MLLVRALKALRWLEKLVAATLLVVLVAVVFVGAAGRYSGHPVLWSDEVAQMLFVWVSLLAGDLTLQRNGHFSVDIFANMLPAKARLVLDLLIYLLMGALLILLVRNAWNFAAMTAIRAQPMTGVPYSWATGALPVGFCLMLITLVELVVRRVTGQAADGEAGPREVM
jgi:TRAP-type C4-dicarboxylate transport system permease small subunit